MGIELKQEVLDELNNWSARQRQAQAAPAVVSLPPADPATSAARISALVAYSSEDLERFAAVPVPMAEWRYLSAGQRRALAAADVLAERRRKAQAFERQAVAARVARGEQAAAELAPVLKKKRHEYERGW